MMSFSQLTEDKGGKNLHLEHLEDEILNYGVEGGRAAINFLQSLRNMLAGGSRSSVNIRSPCNTPLIPNLENSASATLNFAFSVPDKSASISAFVLYNLGLTLKTDFFATKKSPVSGSMPEKIAGAPSHFSVRKTLEREEPASMSRNERKKFRAALPPSTP